MNIYRHTLVNSGSTFYASKKAAKDAFMAAEEVGLLSRVEVLTIQTGKHSVVGAMNLALAHPDHWPGEVVCKSTDPALMED